MRIRSVVGAFITLAFTVSALSASAQEAPANPVVVMETSMGDITIELFRADALVTVVNFLTYVGDGYYDNTIFHRSLRESLIQGGGFDPDLKAKPGLRGSILNEAHNLLANRRGTISMARGVQPNSAMSQFFINTNDNTNLNHKNRTDAGYGYAVFGRVTDGMDVVDRIQRVRVGTRDGFEQLPVDPIVIETIRIVQLVQR